MREMIKVEFNENELNVLMQLLDLGVKSAGLGSVKAASALLVKLEFAVAEAKGENKVEENG